MTQRSGPDADGRLEAAIFDMDGVVTDTASVHAAAWKRLFDDFLAKRAERTGERFEPFDIATDYRRYVDGKPRYDGVRDFLASRGITLPEGDPDEPPGTETVRGLGNLKDSYFLEAVRQDGVEAYPGTIELVNELRAAGTKVAIISASRNLAHVLSAANVSGLFEVRVDGMEAERLGLEGKPAPDVFLEAARRLGVEPARTAVIEDALAGVEAARRGRFGLVVGVDRTGHADDLRAHGADIVVDDPGQLLDDERFVPRDVAAPWQPEPVLDPLWRIELDGWDPAKERGIEAWTTVANGRTGTRGSVEEGSEVSLPTTWVAGVFGSVEGGGRDPVPGPDWTHLEPMVDGEAARLEAGDVLEHRRLLDLRHGILFRTWRQRLPSGAELELRTARFASLADRELMVLVAEASSSTGEVRLAGPDTIAPPEPGGPLERAEVVRPEAGNGATPDRIGVVVHGTDGGSAAFAIVSREREGRVERLVAVDRSLAGPLNPPWAALDEAAERGLRRLADAHTTEWGARWAGADVVVEGDDVAQRALRFALYHLISAAEPGSDLASVGARALSGPGYRGHVFWDNEIFVLPFYIHTHPLTARALLAYRRRTLDAARARARALGYRGALFAWESADTGEDVTPTSGALADGTPIPILTGEQEHHISADVAWAAWRYWQSTGDEAFAREIGQPILLETARFWASRATLGDDGRHHIRLVIGPDEYHEGVDDNAFTNVMARWNIRRALEIAERLRAEDPAWWEALAGELEITDDELAEWATVADGLVDNFDPETGLYEQFAGYFGLEDVDAAAFGKRPYPGDVVLGRERAHRSQVVKQPDVVMLAHLLADELAPEIIEANYRYYEKRTTHGSSLSPAIHAAVAARIGALDEALEYFHMAGAVDLGDAMGNAGQGVHIATMGGLWQAAVHGFGGITQLADHLRIDPRLPERWERLAFPYAWRSRVIRVDVRPDLLDVDLDAPTRIAVGDREPVELPAGCHRATPDPDGGWGELRLVPES